MIHPDASVDECMLYIGELEAEIERLREEVKRLKEIEVKYDQFISGAFI